MASKDLIVVLLDSWGKQTRIGDANRLRKWLDEVVLLNQAHVNADKHEGKTIEALRADLAARTGENVVIRRFARFAVGEA